MLRVAASLALVLAGSVAPTAGPGPPSPPSVPSAVDFLACADQTGHFALPRDEARARVPAPLEPTPFLWTDGAPSGWRWVVVARCDVALEGEAARSVVVVLDTVVVDAPDAWGHENASILAVPFALHTTDPALAAVLRTWGAADARSGDVTFEVEDGPVRAGRATWPGGSLTVEAASEEGRQGDDHVRLFFAHAGEVEGAADLVVTESRVRRGSALSEPGVAGLGGHFWGDDYDYTLLRVDAGALPPSR